MTVNCCYCISLCINELFTDAKAREDGLEDFWGGDGAGDGGEVVEGFAEELGGEVGGDAVSLIV